VLELAAARFRMPADQIINSPHPRPARARWWVWSEIIRLSGCSMNGLAIVWGCERQVIWRALRRFEAERCVDALADRAAA
jgi:hypothetical protein